ncbi:MAG: glycosyl transferase [Burkholderiales bacterium]
MQYAAWAPLTAFAAALVTVWWLTRSRLARLALDHPNPRSLHRAPTPRSGGLGLHLGVLLAWAIAAPGLPLALSAAFALLLLVSFLDDVRSVPVALRLAAHLAAGGMAAAALLLPHFGFGAALCAALAIAWMANLYNFMDGADGLAGGMALFGFTSYGIAAWLAGGTAFALLDFGIATAAAAFLVFNFHPARIFMGDVGSVPLGYLAATFGFVGWLQHAWPWWFPLLVFSPFIVDASVTLIRRLLRGERVWQAHRDHYYQRLVRLGWGHRRTALVEYLLMFLCSIAALAALKLPAAGQAGMLLAFAAAYIVLIAAVERTWRT